MNALSFAYIFLILETFELKRIKIALMISEAEPFPLSVSLKNLEITGHEN